MRPIVFITGQLLTDAIWQPVIDRLPDGDIILADHQGDDTIAGMATRLLKAAPDRFALVAHAMGGFVAFEIMRRAPQRVASLILIATLASVDGPAQTNRRQGYIDLVNSGRFEQVVEERLLILFPPDRRDDVRLSTLVRDMARETGADIFLAQQRAIMARADSRPSLSAIPVPTLLIWGDGDGITTRAQQEEMLDLIPTARLVVLPGAGHLPMIEHADRVAALIGDAVS